MKYLLHLEGPKNENSYIIIILHNGGLTRELTELEIKQ